MTKVLVVEDDPTNAELVREMLQVKDFIVDEAENGKEAIEKAEKEKYDIILMDIGLLGMDGIEVKKIIKNNPTYKEVPVIAITSFAMKGDRERILAAGFDDYIPKPIHFANFLNRLEKYTKQKIKDGLYSEKK